MLTWKIWKTLRHPLRQHPIFRQVRQRDDSPNEANTLLWRVIQGMIAVAALIFIILYPVPALITGAGFAVAIPALILIFNGTFLGLRWVTAISDTLAQAYQDNRFDLLALTPHGALGVSWLMCTATMHRDDWLRTAYRILRWVLMVVLVLLAIIVFGIFYSAVSASSDLMRDNQLRILIDALGIAFIVLALWFDHVQSIVIASIIGILCPAYLRNSWQVREVARFVYLLVQIMTYLLIVGLYLLLEMWLMPYFATELYQGLLHFASTVLVFYFLRELIIQLLWRNLLRRFGTTKTEYQEWALQ